MDGKFGKWLRKIRRDVSRITDAEKHSATKVVEKAGGRHFILERSVLIVMIVVFIIIAAFLIYQFSGLFDKDKDEAPAAIYPIPVMLELPNGEEIALEKGTLDNGSWEPGQAEWLEGTEVCRMIAIPVDESITAAVESLEVGTSITLMMDNDDLLSYMVTASQEVQTDTWQSVLECSTPKLLIILIDGETSSRQVVVAEPQID